MAILKIFVGGKIKRFQLSVLYFDVFNGYFSDLCKPVSNDSTALSSCTYYTDHGSNNVNLNYEKILRAIQAIDSNKSHAHYTVLTWMLKQSILPSVKPLSVIFCYSLQSNTSR